ncbi:NAD(P)-dependent oxidoreductase [Undibacterium sp. TJN19]|uniref:NAD(P)-dependent oxidoreductase n=1 Tax=Undibacterium sp. TJN19 TaxID=3413055 RepID=UPI003BF1D1F9
MKIIILGASGGTGRELTKQALARGHEVIAIVRHISSMDDMKSDQLTVKKGDVYDASSIARIVSPDSVVISGLGVSGKDKKSKTDVLTTGARAVVSANPKRIVWLGAYGSGPSARAAGWVTRTILSLMGDRLKDKVNADAHILHADGSVFHAGILSNNAMSENPHVVELKNAPSSFFPPSISRADVAHLMLDEAETPRFSGAIALPLKG